MDEVLKFTIVETLSDGVQHMESKGMFSLAFLTEDKERLVVWGSEENHHNISLVSKQKIPFCIKCVVVEPTQKAIKKYGDDFWVDEDAPLGIIECIG